MAHDKPKNTTYIQGNGVTPYMIKGGDDYLQVDTTNGAITIYIPNIVGSGLTSERKSFYINDFGGLCATNNITLIAINGDKINGGGSVVLNVNGVSAELVIVNNTEWLANLSTDREVQDPVWGVITGTPSLQTDLQNGTIQGTFTPVNTPVATNDTFKSAFEKLQGQVSGITDTTTASNGLTKTGNNITLGGNVAFENVDLIGNDAENFNIGTATGRMGEINLRASLGLSAVLTDALTTQGYYVTNGSMYMFYSDGAGINNGINLGSQGGIRLITGTNPNISILQTSLFTANRTFEFPNASGTFALLSNLSSYLPLSGGTMLGNLILNADATNVLGAVTLQQLQSYITGLWDDRGVYNASTNLYPSSGGSGTAGAILKGDIWTISVIGTLGGVAVSVSDTVRALVDNPAQISSNWAIAEGNLGYTPLSNVLNSANIFVGNASNVATGVALSGDATINNAGLLTIANNAITDAKIATHTSTKITITNKSLLNSSIAYTDQDNNFGNNFNTFRSGKLNLRNNPNTFNFIFAGLGILADRTVTLPVLASDDTFVFETFIQTLTNKTISGASNTLTNIGNGSLTNSTISGISLGSNLATLTIGTGLTGTSYNGSAAISIAIDSTVATLTGSQTLTNKTLTSPIINVGLDATGDVYYRSAGGAFTRLGVGTNGQVFTVTAGLPSWATVASTSLAIGTTPITSGTIGRLLFEGAGNVLQESANIFWNNTSNFLKVNGSQSLGTTADPNVSCLLDLVSTTKGLGLPSMTTADRDATTSPRDGLILYKNDLTPNISGRIDGAWKNIRLDYTESITLLASPTIALTWTLTTVTGAPANSFVEIQMRPDAFNLNRTMGVRAVGSTLNRFSTLAGSSTSMFVKTNASSQIEVYTSALVGSIFEYVGHFN